MINLFPHDEDARRLSRQTFTLPELLNRLPGYHPPRFTKPVRALVQTHCHQHALLQPELEPKLLDAMGVQREPLDAGCCGMAGSFGFEPKHYEVSAAVGERRLLPAVRQAAKDTVIVADGFSCREQIQQMTHRRGLHLAQLLRLAREPEPPGAYPERRCPQPIASHTPYLLVLGTALAAGALWTTRKRAA